MKYHAFIIPANKQPNLLARIIRILQAPNHYFFIHIDGKVTNYEMFVSSCRELHNIKFVRRIPVYWGTISQVYATLIMLNEVIKHELHFDYIHQISGQDYPLRSNDQFDTFFENTEDSFMCYNYENEIDYWKPIYDQHVNWWYSNGTSGIIDRFLHNHYHSKTLHRFFPRKPIRSIAGGWDWFSWSDKVVDYINTKIPFSPPYWRNSLMRRFNHTHATGEHLWPTLLNNNFENLKIRKHFPLRYISWKAYHDVEQTHRPYDMDERDYERVINSAAFFCRKVDEVVSSKLMDMIDAQRGNPYDITRHDYFF